MKSGNVFGKRFVYVLRNLYRQFPVRFRFDCYLTELRIVQLNIPEKVEFIPSDFKFRLALWKKYFYFWQVLVHVRHNVGHYHARLHTGGTFLLSPWIMVQSRAARRLLANKANQLSFSWFFQTFLALVLAVFRQGSVKSKNNCDARNDVQLYENSMKMEITCVR